MELKLSVITHQEKFVCTANNTSIYFSSIPTNTGYNSPIDTAEENDVVLKQEVAPRRQRNISMSTQKDIK